MNELINNIIKELGYDKENYESYAAQEDIAAAIKKAVEYQRSRDLDLFKEWLGEEIVEATGYDSCDVFDSLDSFMSSKNEE